MLIRAGYDLTFATANPVPMIAMLSVHPSRAPNLRSPHAIRADCPVAMQDYVDGFGNICARLMLPAGRVTLSCDFLVEDGGEPDQQVPDAIQHDIDDLPADVLIYLLGSRYCDTDRLSDTASSLFGSVPPGWQRVQAIVDYVHEHLTHQSLI